MNKFFRFLGSKVFWLNLVLALTLLIGSVFGILYYLDSYTLHSVSIEVPDIKGMQKQELSSYLERMDLTFQVSDSIYSKDSKPGEVLEQHPENGDLVKPDRTIYITVASTEPLKIKMPDLVDLSLRQAQSLLLSYGLEIGELTYQADVCKNCILEQKLDGKPIEAGEKILKGSVIDLTVGEGKSQELVNIPYCIGLNKDAAGKVLNLSSLNIGAMNFDETVLDSDDSMKAKVYQQSPYFTNVPSVSMGSSVDLFFTMDSSKIVHRLNPVDSLKN